MCLINNLRIWMLEHRKSSPAPVSGKLWTWALAGARGPSCPMAARAVVPGRAEPPLPAPMPRRRPWVPLLTKSLVATEQQSFLTALLMLSVVLCTDIGFIWRQKPVGAYCTRDDGVYSPSGWWVWLEVINHPWVSYPELPYCNTAAPYKELRPLKTKPSHLTSVHRMNAEAPVPPFSQWGIIGLRLWTNKGLHYKDW